MRTIFTCATPVIAWLGRQRSLLFHPFEPFMAHDGDCRVFEVTDEALDTVESLLERPWFGRRRIIQEVILSKQIDAYVNGKSIP